MAERISSGAGAAHRGIASGTTKAPPPLNIEIFHPSQVGDVIREFLPREGLGFALAPAPYVGLGAAGGAQ